MDITYGRTCDSQYKIKTLQHLPIDEGIMSGVNRLEFLSVKLSPKKDDVSLHEALFSQHTSFTNANTAFDYDFSSKTVGLYEFCQYESDAPQIFISIAPVIQQIISLSSNKVRVPGESINVNVFEEVLTAIQNHPANALNKSNIFLYRELQLENGSKNDLFGGKIDLVVAESENGRPTFQVRHSAQNKRVSNSVMYCSAMVEAKSLYVGIAGSVNKQNFCQPISEILAMSQTCRFENSDIPLILLFGNRNRYRPLLYFNTHDVLLTTVNPVPFATDEGEIVISGLFLLFVLCYKHIATFKGVVIAKCPQTGWKAAILERGLGNPYGQTVLQPELQSTTSEPPQNLRLPSQKSVEEYMSYCKKRTASERDM